MEKYLPMVIRTGDGDDLFYDSFSGRWFYSSKDAIKKHFTYVVGKLACEHCDWCTMNDFYYEMHIPMIDAGNVVQFLVGDKCKVNFVDDSNEPLGSIIHYTIMYIEGYTTERSF